MPGSFGWLPRRSDPGAYASPSEGAGPEATATPLERRRPRSIQEKAPAENILTVGRRVEPRVGQDVAAEAVDAHRRAVAVEWRPSVESP